MRWGITINKYSEILFLEVTLRMALFCFPSTVTSHIQSEDKKFNVEIPFLFSVSGVGVEWENVSAL